MLWGLEDTIVEVSHFPYFPLQPWNYLNASFITIIEIDAEHASIKQTGKNKESEAAAS